MCNLLIIAYRLGHEGTPFPCRTVKAGYQDVLVPLHLWQGTFYFAQSNYHINSWQRCIVSLKGCIIKVGVLLIRAWWASEICSKFPLALQTLHLPSNWSCFCSSGNLLHTGGFLVVWASNAPPPHPCHASHWLPHCRPHRRHQELCRHCCWGCANRRPCHHLVQFCWRGHRLPLLQIPPH